MLAGFAITLAWQSSALADDKVAEADALFKEGLTLMKAGKYAEACPKLAKSQSLDPGAGTQFRLADCYENVGRLATAWGLFNETIEAAKKAGRKDREAQSRTRADALKPRLPTLLVTVPSDVAALPGLRITLDREPTAPDAWGQPVPIDPGDHIIAADAAGRKAWQQQVSAREGVPLTVTVPLLEADQPPPPVAVPEKPTDGGGGKTGPSKAVVIAGGTVAGVALVVGLGFMGGAIAKTNERNAALAPLPDGGPCKTKGQLCPHSVASAELARTYFITASGWSVIGAGAVAAATAAYAFIPRRPAGSNDVKAAFVAGPGTVGAAVWVPW